MEADCIMPVNYSKPELVVMTGECIASLHYSEKYVKFNVIEVEDKSERFNYNRALCEGLSRGTSEFVILANNDLIFHKNWFSELMIAYNDKIAESFGCWNPKWHERFFKKEQDYYIGDRIGYELTGWIIVTTRKILEKINFCHRDSFKVDFWYSDDLYKSLICQHNIKHALVRNSKVTHLLSKTLKTHPKEKQIELTTGQKQKYLNKQHG